MLAGNNNAILQKDIQDFFKKRIKFLEITIDYSFDFIYRRIRMFMS